MGANSEARLVPLEVACKYYDVDAFCCTLLLFLGYLSYFRGLVPPHRLVDLRGLSICRGWYGHLRLGWTKSAGHWTQERIYKAHQHDCPNSS